MSNEIEGELRIQRMRDLIAVPCDMVTDTALTDMAVRLWCHLCTVIGSGHGDTPDEQIAAAIGLTVEEMREAETLLIETGWATVGEGGFMLQTLKVQG